MMEILWLLLCYLTRIKVVDKYAVELPAELQRLDGCEFTSRGTTYLIRAQESDTSRLVLTDRGTCFDPDLKPCFELRVYEYDPVNNYQGLSGQFKDLSELEIVYGIKPESIQQQVH